MKTTYLSLALALAPIALSHAQSPEATPSVSTPADAAPKKGQHGERRGAMKDLTPEERAKLKAARVAAMSDPEVKTAEAQRSTNRKGYRQALRAAMIRKDPSVEAILSKMKSDRRQEKIF